MKKYICFSLAFLLLLFTACSDSHRYLSGEVSDVRTEDGNIVSFVITDANGKRTGILVPETAAFASRTDLDAGAGKELLLSGQPGTTVHVEYNGGKTSLTASDGEKLPAYTAWFVAVNGYLTPNAAALRDGTPLDVFHWTGGTLAYRLTDGTTLLNVQDSMDISLSLQALNEYLSEAAQKKISAYYEARGLLYSVEDELERAYANIPTHVNGQPVPVLRQDIYPGASSERVIYVLTTLMLPVYGDPSANAAEVDVCDAFDRETGEHIDGWDLFSCSKEEAVQALLDLAQITEQPLRSEAEAAFRPEYMLFYPSTLEVSFPQGTLPSQETSLGFGVDYDDGNLRSLLQDWAVPVPEN